MHILDSTPLTLMLNLTYSFNEYVQNEMVVTSTVIFHVKKLLSLKHTRMLRSRVAVKLKIADEVNISRQITILNKFMGKMLYVLRLTLAFH